MNRLVLTLALILSAYLPSAFGYTYISASCGNLNFSGGNMQFNWANNFTAAERAAITRGTDRATQTSKASIAYVGTVTTWGTSNNRNEVFKDPTHPTAYCSYRWNTSTCNVVEADIAFGNQPWSTVDDYQSFAFGVNMRSMTGTAVHEGGHCVGLGHENRYYNMMGSDFTHVTRDSGQAYYGPGEDMSHGLINRWGKRSTTDAYRDVGVTVMRRSGASGEYSTHTFGVLRNTSGTKLPVVGSFSGQERFRVDAGQTIRVEYTAENNGEKNTESLVLLAFRLSANDIISGADPLIGSTSLTLGRALPLEFYRDVNIPNSTAPGDWFLGLVIDDDFQIPEITSLNNYAFYPIRVVAPDLVVSAFTRTPSSLPIGGSLSMSATARNQGTGASAATTLRYYRSPDATISSADTQVCSDPIPSLAAGATSAQDCTVSVPTTPGTYYYGACVGAVSNESNTGNNCSSGYAVTVTGVYSLSVNSSGATGVAITANPSTYAGTTNYIRTGIASGTSITLTAPSSSGGAVFGSWSGCNSTSGTSCTVSMSSNKSVTANYTLASTYTLTVNSSGAAGVAITANPSTYAGTTNYNRTGIASGTSITLTAPSSSGAAVFSSWSGCNSTPGTSCTVSMISNKTVTVNYGGSSVCQVGTLSIGPTTFGAGLHNRAATVGITTSGTVRMEPSSNVLFHAPSHRYGPGLSVAVGATFNGRVGTVTCP